MCFLKLHGLADLQNEDIFVNSSVAPLGGYFKVSAWWFEPVCECVCVCTLKIHKWTKLGLIILDNLKNYKPIAGQLALGNYLIRQAGSQAHNWPLS